MKTNLGCAALVLTFALAGCTTSSTSTDADHSPGTGSALSSDEVAKAVAASKQEIAKEDAMVTGVTATAKSGTLQNSNTGIPCTSGRLLNVRLIGTFPHIEILPGPLGKNTSADDLHVHAVLLTVDADSGQTCQIGVQTGDPKPAQDSTVLDLG